MTIPTAAGEKAKGYRTTLPRETSQGAGRRGLAAEILAILAFKAVALALLYLAFFSPAHRTAVTAEHAAQIILGAMPTDRRN